MSSNSACPLGQHYVKDHARRTRKSGIVSVAAHCRINPKGKEKLLHASNLRHLYYNRLKKIYPKLPAIKGFRGFHEYDPMIQFWAEYWKDKGMLPKEVDPLLIKAMIAAESSFRPGVRTKDPKSTATGLLQLTESTLKTLKGNPDKKDYIEVKDYPIYLENNERLDPLVNIAAGIRWLGHKIKTSRRRNSKDIAERIFAGVKFYHSWDQGGEIYVQKVYRYYNATLNK